MHDHFFYRTGGHCNHIFALLYLLSHWSLLGQKEIPADKTCTSLPQVWHQPRGDRIEPEPVMACTFAQASSDRGGNRKRPPVVCKLYDARSKCLKRNGWNHQDILAKCGEMASRQNPPPCSYLLSDQESALNVNTVFGNVPLGSYLSYQLTDRKTTSVTFTFERLETQVLAMQDRLEHIISFPDLPVLPPNWPPFSAPSNLPAGADGILAKVTVDFCEAHSIEISTVGQSHVPQWFSERLLRLTASNFGSVLNRQRLPSEAFLRNIFSPKDLSNVASIRHGKQQESTARSIYAQELQKRQKKISVYDVGLVVSPSTPFLGASPDGKVFDPSERSPFGLIEIKVPYSWRNSTFEEACADTNFTCHFSDGKPRLKVHHKTGYYAQVQGQLALTGLPWCDFVVFLSKSRQLNVQRIYFDIIY